MLPLWEDWFCRGLGLETLRRFARESADELFEGGMEGWLGEVCSLSARMLSARVEWECELLRVFSGCAWCSFWEAMPWPALCDMFGLKHWRRRKEHLRRIHAGP